MFVGRTKELSFLNDLYDSDKFEFAVIYGRRRVGKTTLIKEFVKDKDTEDSDNKKEDSKSESNTKKENREDAFGRE